MSYAPLVASHLGFLWVTSPTVSLGGWEFRLFVVELVGDPVGPKVVLLVAVVILVAPENQDTQTGGLESRALPPGSRHHLE